MADINTDVQASMPAYPMMQTDHNLITTNNNNSATDLTGTNIKNFKSALLILASDVNSENVFYETERKMINFSKSLDVNTNAVDTSQGKISSELQKVSEARKDIGASNDISTQMSNLSRVVDVTGNATDVIHEDVRKHALRANYSVDKTTAKLMHVAENSDTDSYTTIWDSIAKAIDNIKTNYVDEYAKLMKAYTDMYDEFNKNVQKAASEAVKAGKDGNTVSFDATKMQNAYRDFRIKKEELAEKLGIVQGWSDMDVTAKENTRMTLSPAFDVDNNGKITFNTAQYNSMPSFPSGVERWETNASVSTSTYQAWLASFNAAGTTLQSNMQSFAQRYSQANNTFDNLNKVLSSAISALAESAKEFLRSLG